MGKPIGIACNTKDIIVLFENELIGALDNTAWQCKIMVWDVCQILVS